MPATFNCSDTGSPDQVSLAGRERPNYIGSGEFMRDKIIEFIKDLPDVSESKRGSLIEFIKSSKDHIAKDIYDRMVSVVQRAEKSKWEAKLEEYFESNPPKYETHKDQYENAPDMLRKVWGEYIDHDVLYQDRLNEYDDKLLPSARRYWQLHDRNPGDTLPAPKPKRADAVLQHVAMGPYTLDEIIRAVRAHDRRDQRARHR